MLAGMMKAPYRACASIVLGIALASCVRKPGSSGGGASMDELFEVRNVSLSILRAPEDVYAFASRGENLPRWASGLGQTIRRVGDEWVADGPLGRVRVRFAPPNDLGVLDHDVALESGATVHNPLRVVPNGAGSTVIFTLLRLPGVSESRFADDAKWVEKDLATLKRLLETPP
jgi:hypothetical protein